MRRVIAPIYHFIDNIFLKYFIHLLYNGIQIGEYDSLLLLRFAYRQKLMGTNFSVPWPVHHTSQVNYPNKIKRGNNTNPGIMLGCFIEASNGLNFGSNVLIGPNVCIISANHNPDDYKKCDLAPPVTIGNDVWIGANSVVVPGVVIGSNVIIGAGSVVTHDIPDNCVAVGNPCRKIKEKKPIPRQTIHLARDT